MHVDSRGIWGGCELQGMASLGVEQQVFEEERTRIANRYENIY